MRRFAFAVAVLCLTAQAHAAEPVLRLGLMPSGTPSALLRDNAPLERYLEHQLEGSVQLESAPDFASFVRRALANEYDLLALAPHLALHVVRRGEWLPLVSVDYGIRPALICRNGTHIDSLAALRGRRVALPDALALITLQAEAELTRAGLAPGKTLEIVHAPNHVSVMEMVLNGLADAGVVSSVLLERLAPERRQGLSVSRYFPSSFSFAYLASARLAASDRARLRELLLRFPATPDGRKFFAAEASPAVRPLTVAELEAFRPFLPTVERRLATGGR